MPDDTNSNNNLSQPQKPAQAASAIDGAPKDYLTSQNSQSFSDNNLSTDSPLRHSINDAQVLLWYATREGKTFPIEKFPIEKVQTIVDADIMRSSGKRNPKLESQFWSAFRDLAAAMQPVSVDSIRATYGDLFASYSNVDRPWWRRLVEWRKRRRGLGNAVSTKRWYSFFALVVLLMIIVIQVYWFIGTTFRSDLEAHREELDKISGSLREMSIKSSSATNQMKEILESIKSAEKIEADSLAKNLASMEVFKLAAHQVDLDFFNNSRRLDRLNLILSGDECLLQKWDWVTTLFFDKTSPEAASVNAFTDWVNESKNWNPCAPQSGQQVASPVMEMLWIQRPVEFRVWQIGDGEWGGNVFFSQSYQEILGNIFRSLEKNQKQVEVSLGGSKSTLAILNQYILPLLYGTLGALAYTLRSLSIEIQRVTFTRGSDIRYSLRWPLGMLAGVTVGLFFDTSKLSGLAAVPPLGLAFLAGYGVELLFTGLDKLVRAFTGGEGDTTAKPAS